MLAGTRPGGGFPLVQWVAYNLINGAKPFIFSELNAIPPLKIVAKKYSIGFAVVFVVNIVNWLLSWE